MLRPLLLALVFLCNEIVSQLCPTLVVVDRGGRKGERWPRTDDLSHSVIIFDLVQYQSHARFNTLYFNLPRASTGGLCLDVILDVAEAKVETTLLLLFNDVLGAYFNNIFIRVSGDFELVLDENLVHPGSVYLIRDNMGDRELISKAKKLKHWRLQVPTDDFLREDRINGFTFGLLQDFAQRHGISFEVLYEPSQVWGTMSANGSFSGVVGGVANRRVEFSHASFTRMYQRAKGVSFVRSLGAKDISLVGLRPRKKAADIWSFINIFDLYSWILVLMTLLLSLVMAICIISVRDWSWVVVFMSRSLVQQGLSHHDWSDHSSTRPSWGLKCLITVWIPGATMLSLMYYTMLTAIIVAPNYEATVDYPEDVIRLDKKLLVKVDTSWEVLTYHTYPQLRPRLVRVSEITSDDITENELAVLSSPLSLDFCPRSSQLYESRHPFLGSMNNFYGWITVKHFPWLKELDRFIDRAVEGGLIQHHTNFALVAQFQWNKCFRPPSAAKLHLTLAHTSFAFLLLGLGLVLSLAIFIFEIVCVKLRL